MSDRLYTYGVSFSRKYCRTLGVDPDDVLAFLLELGFRRFRLMSYWDQIEQRQGEYDFSWLDEDINIISDKDGEVTLSVGLRQPRYPECHPPTWLKVLSHEDMHQAAVSFVKQTVVHYANEPAITSWQLENEALNTGIGTCADYCRDRIQTEFDVIKANDPRPIVMSTSSSWGNPWREPIPDIVGFSLYRSQHDGKKYKFWHFPGAFHKARASLVRNVLGKEVITHELQCEPWGPRSTELLSNAEQMKSMSPERLQASINYAKSTGIRTIDMWGGEWWYWRELQGDKRFADLARKEIAG